MGQSGDDVSPCGEKMILVAYVWLVASSGVTSTYFLRREVDAVNSKLPVAERIPYWGPQMVNVGRIRREYQRLFPEGSLDRRRRLFQNACVVLLLVPVCLILFRVRF